MVIPHIHAFSEKETEIKVAAHDVEVSVPKVAAFFSDETDPKVATFLTEVSVPKVAAFFAKEESGSGLVREEWKEWDFGLLPEE